MPKYDKTTARVTKGRKDALTAVKCSTRGCEGYAHPQRLPDGRVQYHCALCHTQFVLRKM